MVLYWDVGCSSRKKCIPCILIRNPDKDDKARKYAPLMPHVDVHTKSARVTKSDTDSGRL